MDGKGTIISGNGFGMSPTQIENTRVCCYRETKVSSVLNERFSNTVLMSLNISYILNCPSIFGW